MLKLAFALASVAGLLFAAPLLAAGDEGLIGSRLVALGHGAPTLATGSPFATDSSYVDAELYYGTSPIDVAPPTYSNEPSAGESYSGEPWSGAPWSWQFLPEGIIYRSYMAGVHEPRMSAVFFNSNDHNWYLDATLGARVGLIRYGTTDALWPQGWELDVEGAAFPRLNLNANWDVEATDFRVGVPLTYGQDNWQAKFGYYHLSSHLGDEYAIRNDGSLDSRINFSRDCLLLGLSYYVTPAVRLYGESAWAFYSDGGSQPWEFQFGVDYSQPGPTGCCGVPFVALNAHLRQENNFGGNFVAQAGWLWRNELGQTLRTGVHYYNGKSNQFQFFDQFEEQIGLGVWYDF